MSFSSDPPLAIQMFGLQTPYSTTALHALERYCTKRMHALDHKHDLWKVFDNFGALSQMFAACNLDDLYDEPALQ